MGQLIKISRKSKPEATRKALDKLRAVKRKKGRQSLADFYGAAPKLYEDGLTYQKKQRHEWQ